MGAGSIFGDGFFSTSFGSSFFEDDLEILCGFRASFFFAGSFLDTDFFLVVGYFSGFCFTTFAYFTYFFT